MQWYGRDKDRPYDHPRGHQLIEYTATQLEKHHKHTQTDRQTETRRQTGQQAEGASDRLSIWLPCLSCAVAERYAMHYCPKTPPRPHTSYTSKLCPLNALTAVNYRATLSPVTE